MRRSLGDKLCWRPTALPTLTTTPLGMVAAVIVGSSTTSLFDVPCQKSRHGWVWMERASYESERRAEGLTSWGAPFSVLLLQLRSEMTRFVPYLAWSNECLATVNLSVLHCGAPTSLRRAVRDNFFVAGASKKAGWTTD